jgi:hypothetical protein
MSSRTFRRQQAIGLTLYHGVALAATRFEAGPIYNRYVPAAVAIEAQQQPAAELLVDGVMPIAGGGLHHLCDERLRVPKQHVVHLAATRELLFE